jgi:hypothetical protein
MGDVEDKFTLQLSTDILSMAVILNFYMNIYIRILCEIQRLYNVVLHNCILFASTLPTEISKEKYIPIHNHDTCR